MMDATAGRVRNEFDGMSQLWQYLWAKWDEKHGVFHPLWCHLADTAVVVQALWEMAFPSALRSHWQELLETDDGADALAWLMFLAGLHDIGKATPGFQGKSTQHRDRLATLGFDFPLAASGLSHWQATAAIVRDALQQPTVSLQPWEQPDAVAVARTLAGHHGAFPGPDASRATAEKLGAARWDEARRQLIEILAQVTGVSSRPKPPGLGRRHPAALMALAGLVSVADWIASDRELFPYWDGPPDVAAYSREAVSRAQQAVRHLGWSDVVQPTEAADFAAVTGFACPNEIQRVVVAAAHELAEPALVIIEAPTGEGKTEAAFYLADWLNAHGLAHGAYVAMPTQATANAMFGRFRAYLQRRYQQRVNFHLLHAYATLSDDYQQLRQLAKVYAEDEEPEASGAQVAPAGVESAVVAREWFTPRKRSLLAPFGVGTVDQALLAALRTKHVFVRLFGLARKVVIFDEIHAYDTYTSRLIDRLLEWLRELGCSVVMLSATLPERRRKELTEIYTRAAQNTGDNGASYPCVTIARPSQVRALPVAAEPKPPIELAWVEETRLTQTIAERLAGGGCAAVICNTVSKAQDLYLRLRPLMSEVGIEMDLFHARYPFEERQQREQRAVERFGKNGQRPDKAVLVATQVIEQSLDVDFDLMVSELAPVDLLIQRAGRLHRHAGRDRPPGVACRHLLLVQPSLGDDGIPAFDRGTAAIYSTYVLLRTWLALQGRAEISEPGDVQELIEAVYGEQEIELPSEAWCEALAKAREALERRLEKLKSNALRSVVPRPTKRPFALEQMTMAALKETEGDFDPANKLRAVTRWSDRPTISVACLYGTVDGAFLDRQHTLPAPIHADPDIEAARSILGREVTLSGRQVVDTLRGIGTPPLWQRNALLRHLRPAFFDADGHLTDGTGSTIEGPVRIRLDEELGVVFDFADGADEGDE